eukprot:Awhi_evm1s6927
MKDEEYENLRFLSPYPEAAWLFIKERYICEQLKTVPTWTCNHVVDDKTVDDKTKSLHEKTIKIVHISDTHGHDLSQIVVPDGDILIHSGDFSLSGHYDDIKNTSVKLFGYNFYGSPFQPTFCDWAFNVDRGNNILKKWQQIPTDTDILITHGPPLGYGDTTTHDGPVGCVDLLIEVQQRIKPLFHLFGHIHEAYGIYKDHNNTFFINSSMCDDAVNLNCLQAPN